jgi:hypothetical protein
VSMDLFTNNTQDALETGAGGSEGMRVDGERSANDHQGRAIAGRLDGLLDCKAADCLHGNGYSLDHLA